MKYVSWLLLLMFFQGCMFEAGPVKFAIGGTVKCTATLLDGTIVDYGRTGNQNLPVFLYENGEFLIEGQAANNEKIVREITEAVVTKIEQLLLLKGM